MSEIHGPLLRPPSYQPASMEWPVEGPRYVVINPMHIISLQDRTKTLAVRIVEKIKAFSERWFSHVLLMLFLMMYASAGALLFQWLEAPVERAEKHSIIRTRELIIEMLAEAAPNLSRSDFERLARSRLLEFELQLQQHELSKAPNDSQKTVWTFWGSLFYAGTIFTTIGYGNIVPATVAGQAITIIYAFIGIPFLLMVLADLGKLFTRWIKAIFYYIKLFCATGTFKKARKIGRRATGVPVQYMSVAWNKMPYMVAQAQGGTKKRNSSNVPSEDGDIESEGNKSSDIDSKSEDKLNMKEEKKEEKKQKKESKKEKRKAKEDNEADTKQMIIQTPPEEDDDDEFKVPVSLAILMLFLYMMVGAFLFTLWEEWTFFESFYFVFISMSTIGFGDYVPDHPMYMMAAFIYLLFGLALTSMCINVVQEKLSATFEMAKLRIGTTIGLDANIIMDDDMFSEKSDTPDSRRRGSSAKGRRGSKSVTPNLEKMEEEERIESLSTHSKENQLEGERMTNQD